MMKTDSLYYGDCLDWMEKWDDQSVDLIYLDPPFKSDSNYNQLFRGSTDGTAQYRAFHDTWTWDTAAEKRLQSYERSIAKKAYNSINGFKQILGRSGMLAYLTYMAERLEECQRLLKDTGSIYLHCDPTASHYLKIVMDEIFEKTIFHSVTKSFGITIMVHQISNVLMLGNMMSYFSTLEGLLIGVLTKMKHVNLT